MRPDVYIRQCHSGLIKKNVKSLKKNIQSDSYEEKGRFERCLRRITVLLTAVKQFSDPIEMGVSALWVFTLPVSIVTFNGC